MAPITEAQNDTTTGDMGKSSTEVSAPAETNTGQDSETTNATDQAAFLTANSSCVLWRWRQQTPLEALLTPIPPPSTQSEPLPTATLPRPQPPLDSENDHRKRAKAFHKTIQARPVVFDTLVHAMFRISEAATHATFAADLVHAWVTTPDPPYKPLHDKLVHELCAATPLALAAVRVARRAVLLSVAPVAHRAPLWKGPSLSTSHSVAQHAQDEMVSPDKRPGGDNGGDDGENDWWEAGKETTAIFDIADAAARTLCTETTSGGSQRWRVTEQLVSALELARTDALTAQNDADDFLSSRCRCNPSARPALEAIKHAAKAVAHLAALAKKTVTAASTDQFLQRIEWTEPVRQESGSVSSSYKAMRQQATIAIVRATAASVQAVAAATAVAAQYNCDNGTKQQS